METLIVCFGDERVCDDGVGALVARVLQSLPLPPKVTVRTPEKVSFDLLDKVAVADQLVVVDAVRTGDAAGTCTVADVTELPAGLASSECSHQEGVSQILDFVRYVACDGNPRRAAIAAIEGKQFLSCGTAFSDEVWSAVPRLVDLILLYVGATVEARMAVKDLCVRLRAPDCAADQAWSAPSQRRALLAV